MQTAGLWMLLVLGVLVPLTGMPVWALLVGVSSVFALLGLATGAVDVAVLAALPSRLVGLLEHDLLQAMPLYVFVGVLLQRVAVADALFDSLSHLAPPWARRGPAADALAGLGVGALLAPMNGSVASSSVLLGRLAGPRLQALAAAPATALVSVAATIGVVVPPSLVLILLGDAMLRAHTEASNLPGYAQTGQRIVNTQDILHAALPPALLLLVLWLGVAWWQARSAAGAASGHGASPTPPLPRHKGWLAGTTVAGIVLLLAGVFSGRLLPVEGAATAGCVLVAGILLTHSLPWPAWNAVLHDSLALSGALFALLAGATSFSLVLRLFGTDAWLSQLLLHSALPAPAVAGLALLLVMLCAWVLDAFEMIFVVIPIVAPVLVLRLGDAQQAAVLLLLVLQLSFLLPPMGYAVLMARAQRHPIPGHLSLLKALWPYLAAQMLVLLLVFSVPAVLHLMDGPPSASDSAPALSAEELTRQMQDMLDRPQDEEPATSPPAEAESGKP